ncbi:MAG: 30S ribosome-binding factor RbfA [Rhodospirillaceae bacterium]
MASHHPFRPPSQRQLRVGEEIRHVLADLFRRSDFRDPALQGINVTVTQVRTSPDLRNATAYITPLGGGDIGETVKALRHAASFLRGRVAHEMKLRFAPALSFEPDTTFDQATRIEQLLHLPEVARDLAPHVKLGDTIDTGEDAEDGA